MQYNRLGQSDLHISGIAFGCMSLDLTKDNEALLRSAVDQGINLFDTADLYDKGENEKVLGKALKSVRKEVYIATKVGNQWRSDGSGWDWNPSKAQILQAVEASLLRLDTDYIDLYQLHGGTMDDPYEETLEAFELLKDQGKILNYGISSIRPNVIKRWLNHSQLTSIMMQYSLLDRRPEEQCLNWAYENNVGILARGSLAKGLLVDKPHAPYLNWSDEQVKKMQSTLTESGERPAIHTALRYVLHHQAVTTAVVGIRTLEQLEQASKTFKTPELTSEEYESLQNTLDTNQYRDHLL